MIDCPKFAKMQKMFHGKSVRIAKTQIVNADVNVADVNVTTRSKVIEEQVFKDKKPRKIKKLLLTRKKKGD
jgi:hypothetical protein